MGRCPERDIIPDGDPDVLVSINRLYNELVMDRMDWWLNISRPSPKSAFDRQVVKEAEIKLTAGTTRSLPRNPRAKAVVTAEVELTENNALAFDIWYLMGGACDWDALQFLLEYSG